MRLRFSLFSVLSLAVLCAGLLVIMLVPWFTLVLPRLFKFL